LNRKTITFISYFVFVFIAFIFTIISPLLPEISVAFSVGMIQTGSIFSASCIGFLIFSIIGGMLADRFGKKVVLSISLFGYAIALFLFPNSPNFNIALFSIFLMGGFNGTIQSIVGALIIEVNPKKPAFYLNLGHMFFGVGALLGPLVVGFLLPRGVSWHTFYFTLSFISFLSGAFFISINLPSNSKSSEISWGEFKKLMFDKKILLICFCIALYNGSEIGSWGWMATFLKKNLLFSIEKSGIAVSIFWLSMTIGRLLCSILTLHINTRQIITYFAFFAAIVSALSSMIVKEFQLWPIIILMGLTYSGLCPLMISYGSAYYKSSSGTLFALLMGSGSFGIMIVPFLMGIIAEKVNTRIAMSSPAILLFIVAIIFYSFKRKSLNLTNNPNINLEINP
jgi:fucose permease